jgi:hypothetical protein
VWNIYNSPPGIFKDLREHLIERQDPPTEMVPFEIISPGKLRSEQF